MKSKKRLNITQRPSSRPSVTTKSKFLSNMCITENRYAWTSRHVNHSSVCAFFLSLMDLQESCKARKHERSLGTENVKISELTRCANIAFWLCVRYSHRRRPSYQHGGKFTGSLLYLSFDEHLHAAGGDSTVNQMPESNVIV